MRPVALSFALLLASVPASAQHKLTSGALTARLAVQNEHLAAPVFESPGRAAVEFKEPFTLTLADGRTLAGTAMRLRGEPTLFSLPAEPGASRSAARLPGQQLCADLDDAASGLAIHWCLVARELTQTGGSGRSTASYLRQELTLTATRQPVSLTNVTLLTFHAPSAHVVGSVPGSPIVAGDFFFGFEHPLSQASVSDGLATASISRTLPLAASQSITYSAVIGVARPGQMRRDFLSYIELERAHPYHTFLHPNTWYDLGEGQRYSADQVMERLDTFGTELVTKRHVTMDSYLMDDGWDNTKSLWGFNPGFPQGLTPLQSVAQKYGFKLGVWLSPWGGYDKEQKERTAFGQANGYELIKNLYALSGPKYYAAFEKVCLEFVTRYGVNQFKLDGTGNAGSVFPGSLFDSDFAAAIHLIERLRREEPDLFINLTTGTKPSPFWLRYADSIYRAGEDHDFDGEGTWRQRWITYRDEQTYRNVVQKGPLFPLNSLMLHGIIYAQKGEHLADDPGHDFADEVHSFFGSGTNLQELYITPSLLSPGDWDTLAEAARWSRANATTLVDTHWVGGDPGNNQAYGWAAWSPAKAIITLRNPSSKPQDISLDPAVAFELPPGASTRFTTASPWPGQSSAPPSATLEAHHPHTFHLAPFQVLTLEATPAV